MSVLLDKFFLRSFLASLYPVSAYSLGFLLCKLIGNVPIAFFNYNACIILAFLCLFWPLQNIGLWMFFGSIEAFIKRKMRGREPIQMHRKAIEEAGSSKGQLKGKSDQVTESLLPFSLKGNYKPTNEEK